MTRGRLEFFKAGKKGETHVIPVYHAEQYGNVMFRGDEIEIGDSLGGSGTKICYFLIGGRIQYWFHSNGEPPKLTKDWLRDFDGKCKFDTCHPALLQSVMVEFIEDCEFKMVVFGQIAPWGTPREIKISKEK